jgi:hypothetical protein
MLPLREYKPKGNELLYHYCSAEAFHAICTNKTIRMSDLFTMNDYLELQGLLSLGESRF